MNDLNVFMAVNVMRWRNAGDWFLDGDDYWMGDGTSSIFTGMKCKDWHPDTDLNQSIMCRDKFLMDNPTYQFSLYSYRNLENEIINHVYLEDGHGNIYESLLSKLSLGVCEAIKQAVENGSCRL